MGQHKNLKKIAQRCFDSRGNLLYKSEEALGTDIMPIPSDSFLTALEKGMSEDERRKSNDVYPTVLACSNLIEEWLGQQYFTKFQWLGSGKSAFVFRALKRNGEIKVVRIERAKKPFDEEYDFVRPDVKCVAQPISQANFGMCKAEIFDEYLVLNNLQCKTTQQYALSEALKNMRSQTDFTNTIFTFNVGIDRSGNVIVFDPI